MKTALWIVLGLVVVVAGLWLAAPLIVHGLLGMDVATASKTLPRNIDSETREDSCMLGPDNTIHFHLTFTSIDSTSDAAEAIKAKLKPLLVENARTNLTTLSYWEMYFGAVLEYDCFTNQGAPLADIEIRYADVK